MNLRKKHRTNKILKKFVVKQGVIVLSGMLTIICLCVYFYISYELNIETINANSLQINVALLSTIKDVLVVLISILGTNLLIGLLVDVSSKNNLVTHIMENDIISDPYFYTLMEVEQKEKMLNGLIENIYFDNKDTKKMFYNILDKLKCSIDEYYFDKCEYIVSCNIYDNYIEKTITKKVEIKSFDENIIIKDFGLGSFASRKVAGLNTFELISVEVNGEKMDATSEDIKLVNRKLSNLDEQNKYDSYGGYIYGKNLHINNSIGTKISVSCVTRTSKDDITTTFRVTKPCRNFALIYSIKQHEKYRIAVDAFGFLDDADDSTNNRSDSNINIKFDDWIFENDGVVVSVLDKS